MLVNHRSPLPNLGLAQVPDDQRLAMVVQGIDDENGLHAWPIPLNVARHWIEVDTRTVPAGRSPDVRHDPSLSWLTVDRIEALLQRLNRELPCSGEQGWHASTCSAVEERDGQPQQVTVWVIHAPRSAGPSGARLDVQQTVRRVRQALIPLPDEPNDWAFPPVLYVPVTQRPTGYLMMLDDTIEEDTVRAGVRAMREHVAHVQERRALNLAAGGDESPSEAVLTRGRTRL